MTYKERFIEFMAKSGALTFGDFVGKSGRRMPYFINTGNYNTGSQLSELSGYYAACIRAHMDVGFDALFGPAYKGIPLATGAAAALWRDHGVDIRCCFNRKEAKDHGEGGSIVGYVPREGDRIAIVEDVVTAGTAVRESMEFLTPYKVDVTALFISVDRMERGPSGVSAIESLKDELGIEAFPIVTVRDIMTHLHNREVAGRVYIDDAMLEKMEEYLTQYGVANRY